MYKLMHSMVDFMRNNDIQIIFCYCACHLEGFLMRRATAEIVGHHRTRTKVLNQGVRFVKSSSPDSPRVIASPWHRTCDVSC